MKKKIAALYLAAGKSSRMGSPKLSIPVENIPLGQYALAAALGSSVERIFIIMHSEDNGGWLPACVESYEKAGKCKRIVCLNAHLGMAYSLQSGLVAAKSEGYQAVVVLLADQPLITCNMINRLIEVYAQDSSFHYIASGEAGRTKPKPPLLLSLQLLPLLMSLSGDQGARRIIQSSEYRGAILTEQANEAFWDADTPDDIRKIQTFLQKKR